MCFKFLVLGAKPLYDVYELQVSYLEVDTWLGALDMTWDSLKVFMMTLYWELVTLHEVCELYVICAHFGHV
jgi:hypothetical protein